MIYLVFGGASSGKSEFAEELAQGFGGEKIYFATMKPFGDDAEKKIQKHRKMREKKGFRTVEWYENLEDFSETASVILLECVGNLVANEMFSPCFCRNVWEKIWEGILSLEQCCSHLILVSNDVFCEQMDYDTETMVYLEQLGEINKKIGESGAKVYEIVCSIPIEVR